MRLRLLLLASAALLPAAAPAPAGGTEGAAITNPYYDTTEWKVWRDDPTPVPGIANVEGKEKKEKIVERTIQPPPAGTRLFPVPLGKRAGALVALWKPAAGSTHFAGCWDDVYTSWSGLHGYVRNRWMAPGGTKIEGVKEQIIHFVGAKARHTQELGVNFIHKSTTGMGHTIVNDVQPGTAERYEKLYFGSALLTAPAHISFSEDFEAQTKDLYLGLNPTILNSVGSSNSETMAITKMIIAGAYLDPELKALLKRQGLYASTMLYLWKAALPFDVPFDHELKQRIAYKAVGNRHTYPEKYGAAGINRGDRCLVFHQYDDAAHVRNMIALATALDGPLPEALVTLEKLEGGTKRYDLKKSISVVQEAGDTVVLTVSAGESYDLRDRALQYRWTVLYGNRATTVQVNDAGDGAVITVPWDDTLPEGRTVIQLTANNGTTDGNPAMISVFRKKLEALPPSGGGYKDYVYDMTHVNRRPVVTGAQDQMVRPRRTLTVELNAVDPDGRPVRWYKRAGDPGELDGNLFTWKVPRRMPPGAHPVSFIASDGTAGNSYAGRTVNFHVGAPKSMPRVTADKAWGTAPLTVKCTTRGSVANQPFGWEVYPAAGKHKAKPFKKQRQGGAFAHMIKDPVSVTVAGAGPGNYSVSFIIKGTVAKEIFYKLSEDGEFKSTGFMAQKNPMTGQPYPQMYIVTRKIKPGENKVWVKYKNAKDEMVGPFEKKVVVKTAKAAAADSFVRYVWKLPQMRRVGYMYLRGRTMVTFVFANQPGKFKYVKYSVDSQRLNRTAIRNGRGKPMVRLRLRPGRHTLYAQFQLVSGWKSPLLRYKLNVTRKRGMKWAYPDE